MKTLDEYNKDSQFAPGIACNKCGHELTRSPPVIVLTSYPGQERVHCNHCEYKGTMYV